MIYAGASAGFTAGFREGPPSARVGGSRASAKLLRSDNAAIATRFNIYLFELSTYLRPQGRLVLIPGFWWSTGFVRSSPPNFVGKWVFLENYLKITK